MKYSEVVEKIPNSPLQFIVSAIFLMCGYIGNQILMRSGLIETTQSKVLYLTAMAIICVVLVAAERKYYKYLIRKKGIDMTKEEWKYFSRINNLLVLAAFTILALVMFYL